MDDYTPSKYQMRDFSWVAHLRKSIFSAETLRLPAIDVLQSMWIDGCCDLQVIANAIRRQTGYGVSRWMVFKALVNKYCIATENWGPDLFNLRRVDLRWIDELDDIRGEIFKDIPLVSFAIPEARKEWETQIRNPDDMLDMDGLCEAIRERAGLRLDAWDVFKIIYWIHWEAESRS